MRILHLSKYFHPEIGGIESYVYILAKKTAKKHETFVIASNTSRKFIFEEIDGIKVFRLPRILWILHTPFTSPFICLIKKIKPDLIHLHIPNPWFEFNLFLYCLLYKKSEKPRIVVTYHSDVIAYSPFHAIGEVLRRIYVFPLLKLFSEKIIATSKNYVDGSPILKKLRRKISIIPLGIDTKKFRPIKQKAKCKRKILLFLGRLFPYKGLEYLLKAIKIVSEKREDFILFIAGEGKLRKKLEKIVKELKIQSFVVFTGKVPDEQIVKYYNFCDIFILPSIYKSEAFGISQVEAMACGKPVISCDIKGSGVPWVNQHMKTGLVVEPKNSKALANAILYLLENEKIRNIMGKNARKRVLKHFTEEKMVTNTLKVCEMIE